MIFAKLLSIGIFLLFISLHDRTYGLDVRNNSRNTLIHPRQSGLGGMTSKLGGGGGGGSGCKSYIMMGARGTTEPQGRSAAYTSMAKRILQKVPNGGLMDVQYSSSAEYMVTPKQGTKTALSYIKSQLSKCPDTVFLMMGYSKGCMVHTGVLTSKDLPPNKVIAVVFFGNPGYKPNSLQNSCEAKTGNGIASAVSPKMPSQYQKLTYDCCLRGDMICQTVGSMGPHLMYPTKSVAAAEKFMLEKLKGISSSGSSSGSKQGGGMGKSPGGGGTGSKDAGKAGDSKAGDSKAGDS